MGTRGEGYQRARRAGKRGWARGAEQAGKRWNDYAVRITHNLPAKHLFTWALSGYKYLFVYGASNVYFPPFASVINLEKCDIKQIISVSDPFSPSRSYDVTVQFPPFV